MNTSNLKLFSITNMEIILKIWGGYIYIEEIFAYIVLIKVNKIKSFIMNNSNKLILNILL